MKATIFSMLMLVLAASSFGAGEIQAYNFEGADPYGFGGGTVVEGIGATTPTHSLMYSKGGWTGTWEMYLNGTPAKDALASVGTVIVDVTTVASDFPEGWGSMGLLINAGGDPGTGYVSIWNVFDWRDLAIGTTQTLTFQFPAAEMAKFASYNWWFNVGFAVNSSAAIAAEYDPITGELITAAVTPTYYFDNVQIVPEPATLALLGLGALSLIRRKK